MTAQLPADVIAAVIADHMKESRQDKHGEAERAQLRALAQDLAGEIWQRHEDFDRRAFVNACEPAE